jgi:hypothetical protein
MGDEGGDGTGDDGFDPVFVERGDFGLPNSENIVFY